jgi:hypothetical protein
LVPESSAGTFREYASLDQEQGLFRNFAEVSRSLEPAQEQPCPIGPDMATFQTNWSKNLVKLWFNDALP